MATLTIPDELYARLERQAIDVRKSPDALATEMLMSLGSMTVTEPLSGEAWLEALGSFEKSMSAVSDKLPVGFIVDDSRVAIYEERLRGQL